MAEVQTILSATNAGENKRVSYSTNERNKSHSISARTAKLAQALALLSCFCATGIQAQVSTAGSGGVSPSGGFNYSIPIRMPPGTTGVQPSLSLSYNSQGGNGIAGVGWNVSGLSVITRCAANAATDAGVRGAVNLDTNDKLCMDGQRLLVQSGIYGQPGAVYFTEIFNGSRITQRGSRPLLLWSAPPPTFTRPTVMYSEAVGATSPATIGTVAPKSSTGTQKTAYASTANDIEFWVETKAGELMEYVRADLISGLAIQPTRMWLLSRVTDTYGNYWTVDYNRDSVNGEYTAAAINYTGNSLKALLPYNSVEFVYEARPDPSVAYLGGVKVSNTKRLTTIRTKATPSGGTTQQAVTEYRMAYAISAATQRSILQSVQEFGIDGAGVATALNPLTFKSNSAAQSGAGWGSGSSPTQATFFLPQCNPPVGKVIAADVNNDGITDLVCVSRTSTVIPPVPDSGNPWGSETDIATSTYVQLGSLNSGLSDWTVWSPTLLQTASGFDILNCQTIVAADVNGDGKTDMVCVYNYGNNQEGTFVQLSAGVSSTGWQTWGAPTGAGNFNPRDCSLLTAVDVDGDGLADIVCVYNYSNADTATYVRYSTGTAFTGWSTWGPRTGAGQFDPNYCAGIYPADVNGDGIVDLVCPYAYRDSNGSTANEGTFVELGKSGRAVSVGWQNWGALTGAGNFEAASCTPMAVADINGDGKSDLACVYDYGNGDMITLVRFSTGTSFTNWTAWSPRTGAGNFNPKACQSPQLVDINGDGMADVVCVYNYGGGSTAVFVQLSKGLTTAGWQTWTPQSGPNTFDATRCRSVTIGDYDGDGKVDIYCPYDYGNGTSRTYVNRTTPIGSPDLMSQAKSSLGLAVDITYTTPVQSLNSAANPNGRYYKQLAPALPLVAITPAMSIVSDLSSDNAIGGKNGMTYWYGTAVNSYDGRGFLGFHWQQTLNNISNIASLTYFNQAWPFIGSPGVTLTWTGGTGLSRQDISYTSRKFQAETNGVCAAAVACTPGQSCIPYSNSTTSKSWDLDNSTVPSSLLPQSKTTSTIDCYGNNLSVLTDSLTGAPWSAATWDSPPGASTGYTKTITNEYITDTTNWWIGRLKKSSVTSNKPAN
jgi:FG-GAP-like repeat/Salmonella virulence plasmid 65kDa B protein